jgi:hypothetical protein
VTRGGKRPGAGRPLGARDGRKRAPGSGGARAGAGRPKGALARHPQGPTVELVRAALARDPPPADAEIARELGITRQAVSAAIRRWGLREVPVAARTCMIRQTRA